MKIINIDSNIYARLTIETYAKLAASRVESDSNSGIFLASNLEQIELAHLDLTIQNLKKRKKERTDHTEEQCQILVLFERRRLHSDEHPEPLYL